MSKQAAVTLCGTLLLAMVAGCATPTPVAAPTQLMRTQADQSMANQDQGQLNQQQMIGQQATQPINQQGLPQNQAIGQLSTGCQAGQQSLQPVDQSLSANTSANVGSQNTNVGSLSTTQPAVPSQQGQTGAMNQGY